MSDDLVSRLLDGIVAPEGAFNDDPPIWAQDPFNGDTAEKCGRCDAWRSVVRPGKTQCDYCCDSDDYGLRIKAAQALTETRAEIERLRAKPPLLDAQSLPGVDALVKTLEAQLDEALRSCLAEREGRLKAESELSTLRARVREVVGPFGNLAQRYDDTVGDGWIPWTEFITDHEWPSEIDCRAARQLMEEVK